MNETDKAPTRRAVLIGAAGAALTPILVRRAEATPATMKAAIYRVIGELPVSKGRVSLDIPPLVENGNTIAMTVSVESPMTRDRLRQGDPRLQREEPAARCDLGASRPARAARPRSRPASASPIPRP